jgi:hypothetical protein
VIEANDIRLAGAPDYTRDDVRDEPCDPERESVLGFDAAGAAAALVGTDMFVPDQQAGFVFTLGTLPACLPPR